MCPEAKWTQRVGRYRRERPSSLRGTTASYIWRIAPRDMRRTRPGHLRLNGKTFRWDDPPVVNSNTGERGHPGMDRHCRCYAEPVPE